MAPIAVGDSLPDGSLSYFDAEDKLQQVSIHSLAAGKQVILFGVPGAFTPTCSLKHVPGFIEKAAEFKSKGINEIICISGMRSRHPIKNYMRYANRALWSEPNTGNACQSAKERLVNDPFVMKAWAKTYPENKDVKFLADGSATYTHTLGLQLDLSEKGLGTRSKRFALLVDNLKVKAANIEQ
ncbi:hypothetical protein GOBAR_DD24597 [Gossypium barbadense]|nr:hypothetical protein GOBAR_DD24597 [Gossypium barbadense]